jgi:hypothetical protein
MSCIGSKQSQAVKPLDPIALGVVPMGEFNESTIETLGGIEQWKPQDHERYRLFYQQNHWNYMKQMMQQASTAAENDESGTASASVAAIAQTLLPQNEDSKFAENFVSEAMKMESKPTEGDVTEMDDMKVKASI